MAATTILALCASALLVQSSFAQCIGSLNPGLIGYGGGLGYGNGLGARVAGAELAAAGLAGYGSGAYLGAPMYGAPAITASGGGLTVSSASLIAPSGISVVSENAIEGLLEVAGQLPVLAAVALEGALPTAGAAGVTYSCGNGNVGIASESLAASGLAGAIAGAELAGIGAGLAGAGYGSYGLANAAYGGLGLANAGLAGAGLAGVNGIRGCGCGIY